MDQKPSQPKQTAEQPPDRVSQWIAEGKDPATAHWQGALEDMLNLFKPSLIPGRLMPVYPMEDEDLKVFLAALEVVDLSPGLPAAFLPPAISNKISPPESLKSILRIETGKPSYKILVARPGKDQRVLCAELSEAAHKPGVEIFQGGVLLGTYDFESQKDCLAQLARILRVHLWNREKWSREDYLRYGVNWFEKVLDLQKETVAVEASFSFFHSPTLIKADRIDALFLLIFETLQKRLQDPEDPFHHAVAALRKAQAPGSPEDPRVHALMDQAVFDLLAVIRKLNLFSFDTMTNRETDRFNRESAGTMRRLAALVFA